MKKRPLLKKEPGSSKPLWLSKTLWGIGVAIAAKLLPVTSEEFGGVASQAQLLWPIAVGVSADLGAAWTRVRATVFDKSVLRSRTFWLQVGSAGLTILSAAGFDVTGLGEVFTQASEHVPALLALAGSVWSIFGRLVAREPIR